MAMELLDGTDLRDAIDGELLRTLDEKLDVMDSILAALDYAHAKGVVHRDVKPANIHLVGGGEGSAERQVKIMDFGLARVSTSEMTQEGIVLGTPELHVARSRRSATRWTDAPTSSRPAPCSTSS